MRKAELFQDKKKEWRFRILASNGKIIAQSEGYTRRASAMKGVHAVYPYSYVTHSPEDKNIILIEW